MKTIPLTNSDGQAALVDDADYPEISRYAWRIRCGEHKRRTVVQVNGSKSLHSVLMNPAPGLPVIHIDGNYLNCQRDNLFVPEPIKKQAKSAHPHVRIALDGKSAAEIIRLWLSTSGAKWSAATTQRYIGVLSRFFTFLKVRDDKPVNPANLTVSDVSQYIDHMLKDHKRATVNGNLNVLKTFFTWRAGCSSVDDIGAMVPQLVPEPSEQRALTDEEYRAILTSDADPTDKDIVQFLAHTGLKRAEFLALKWSHITGDMASIRMPEKDRIIPLSTIAKNILAKYRNQGDTAIPFVVRHRTPCTVNRLCNRVAKCAGIAAFNPLALRHYFCTRLARAGISIQKISKVLGHSSVELTIRVYPHLWPTDLTGIADALTE